MNCVSCGTPNPDQAQTCLACGTTLPKDQAAAPDTTISTPSGEQRADEHVAAATDEATVQGQPMPSEQFVFEGSSDTPPTQEAGILPTITEPPAAEQFLFDADAPMMDSERALMPLNASSNISLEILDTAPPAQLIASRLRRIAQPLPLWAFLVGIAIIVGGLTALQMTGRDWAEGAWYVAIAAASIAFLIALATGVRSLAGMAARSNPRRLRQYVSSSLSILVLLLCSMPGLAFQSSIHTAQGHYLETQQQWQAAINEYKLGGDKRPTSENIARTYNEWGESLSQAQNYMDAIAKFDTVQNDYSAVKAEVSRSQNDNIEVYLAWGEQAMQQKHYNSATFYFSELASQPYCTAQCQQRVGRLNATAYYDLAEDQLSQQNYEEAAYDFRHLQTHFPDSPEAKLEHRDMAKALLGDAKIQKGIDCSIATSDYKDLAAHFADTPEGVVAKLAMLLPQSVTGQFPAPATNPGYTEIAALAQGIKPVMSDADFFVIVDSGKTPRATVNDDGTFKFDLVPQGQYLLVWGFVNNSSGAERITNGFDYSQNPLVPVNVGPICPTDLGYLNWGFPYPLP